MLLTTAFISGLLAGLGIATVLALYFIGQATQRAHIGAVQRCVAAIGTLHQEALAEMGADPYWGIINTALIDAQCRLRAELTTAQREWLALQKN